MVVKALNLRTQEDDNTVAVNIRRLRAKILDSDDNRMIRNVRGMGYVWDCEVMQKM